MTKASAKAPATADVLTLTRHFNAPREAVFRAWTDPAELAKWIGPEGIDARDVEIDLRPGGSMSLEFFHGDGSVILLSCTYREISPPERLVFTWTWGSGDIAGIETLVTIELAETSGGTELSLTHERLPNDEARHKHNQGWTSTLTCLERLLRQ